MRFVKVGEAKPLVICSTYTGVYGCFLCFFFFIGHCKFAGTAVNVESYFIEFAEPAESDELKCFNRKQKVKNWQVYLLQSPITVKMHCLTSDCFNLFCRQYTVCCSRDHVASIYMYTLNDLIFARTEFSRITYDSGKTSLANTYVSIG